MNNYVVLSDSWGRKVSLSLRGVSQRSARPSTVDKFNDVSSVLFKVVFLCVLLCWRACVCSSAFMWSCTSQTQTAWLVPSLGWVVGEGEKWRMFLSGLKRLSLGDVYSTHGRPDTLRSVLTPAMVQILLFKWRIYGGKTSGSD